MQNNTNTERNDALKNIAIFLILVAAFYAAGWWLIFRMGKATPLMLSAGAATIATCLICKIKISDLGWQWHSWRYQWLSYTTPLIYAFLAYLVIWLFSFGGFYDTEFVNSLRESYNLANWNDMQITAFHLIFIATIGFISVLPSVLGEELAWRGFLVPELNKFMSFTGVALVSGLIWSVWHWPLMFKGFYGNGTTPLLFQLTCFTVYIIAISTIMAYLRLKTGSLWTAVIFHMSVNVFQQKFFAPLTIQNDVSPWFVDEFGATVAIITSLFAFYYWQRAKSEFNNQIKSRPNTNLGDF